MVLLPVSFNTNPTQQRLCPSLRAQGGCYGVCRDVLGGVGGLFAFSGYFLPLKTVQSWNPIRGVEKYLLDALNQKGWLRGCWVNGPLCTRTDPSRAEWSRGSPQSPCALDPCTCSVLQRLFHNPTLCRFTSLLPDFPCKICPKPSP